MFDVPNWSYDLERVNFDQLIDFEEFLIQCEDILQQELELYNYNTFNSFIEFYDDYKKVKNEVSLVEFITNYKTKISVDSLSCVGLALSLIARLRKAFPHFGSCISLVSCEEAVEDTDNYCMKSPNNVKEHVLVSIPLTIESTRHGFILLDPGYHVARPVIVMNDMSYPHTGWFTYANNSNVIKEFCYQIINDKFIGWKVKETKNKKTTEWCNLIYVKQAFVKCLTITEKRSLVFSLKSLVIRDKKGPIAGMYCWIESNNLTIFYNVNGKKVTNRIPFNQLDSVLAKDCINRLASFIKQANVDVTARKLSAMIVAFKEAIMDKEFMSQLKIIDQWIES